MLMPTEILQFLQGRQTQAAQSPINRGAPAVAPNIPIPGNQNMAPGGYMQQAMQLSGVPAANQTAMVPQQQAPQANPMSYIQTLMSTPGGQAQLQQILSALMGRR